MTEMLIVIGITVITVALVFISNKLRVNNVIKADDLDFAVIALKLSLSIVEEMNLDNEEYIATISMIIVDALEFAVDNMTGDYSDLLTSAETYAFKACESVGVELTDNRKEIIIQLIEIALKNQVI